MVILTGKFAMPYCVKYLFKESEGLEVDHDPLYSRYWVIKKSHNPVPELTTTTPCNEIMAMSESFCCVTGSFSSHLMCI
jgi:hypothetical protein